MSYIVVEKMFGTRIGHEFPVTEGTEKYTLKHLHRRFGKKWERALGVYKKVNDYDGTCISIKEEQI